MTNTTSTRRRVMKTAAGAAGATVIAPAFVDVASADTASGYVELDTTATVPTNTTIEITIFEDTDGDGSADRQQTESIPDGTATTQYDLLESSTAQGDVLWMQLSLSTSDDSVTPSLDSATITLPAKSSDPVTTTEYQGYKTPAEEQGLFELLDNFYAYVSLVILGVTGMGLASKSMALASFGGYLTFVLIALETGNQLLMNIAYVTFILVFLGMAFKLVRLEFGGDSA